VNVGGYREILLPLKEGDNIVGTATGTTDTLVDTLIAGVLYPSGHGSLGPEAS
jgi:hypothetical protein